MGGSGGTTESSIGGREGDRVLGLHVTGVTVCGATASVSGTVELVSQSDRQTHLLKNPLSSSSLSPPEHQSAPLYGCLLSATHILFTLLLSA